MNEFPRLSDPALLRERCLINGEWVAAADGALIPVVNPANGQRLAAVPALGVAEVEGAIAHAAAAQPGWAALTAKERAAVLLRWHGLLLEHAGDLAAIMTAEQGKPLAEARGEIHYAASFIEWFAHEGKRLYGETIPSPWPGQRLLVLKEAVGVCAAITPWNFPAAMITRKVAPALAAGCVMIVRPAELTPLTALALGELAVRAGIPAGVLQFITGEAERLGGVLTQSPAVAKVSFTGSTRVGRLLMAQCAPTLKRLSLELGGNAPFIVFDDADLDAAVDGAIASKFRNAGQTCVCANRFYVQAGVYEAFTTRLAERAAQLVVGEGTQEGVQIGPLINAAALAKVQSHVEDALALGARLVQGGRPHALGGLFYEPTVLADANGAMKFAREETFGPVAPVFRFESEAEAITLANASEYGLAAYFYTRDAARFWRVSGQLAFGMVGHNTGVISCEVAPFGGVKQSGFGREGAAQGMDEYVALKTVYTAV